LEKIHRYYSIVHFDEEIYKQFQRWYLSEHTKMPTYDGVSDCEKFIQYNMSSNVNTLYIKFNTICDL
jgi:hypothetical protein